MGRPGLLLTLCCAIGAVAWWGWPTGPVPDGPPAPAPDRSETVPGSTPPGRGDRPVIAEQETGRETVAAAPAPVLSRRGHRWAASLGGVRGRVLDGTPDSPAVGLRVRLIELLDGRTRAGAAHPFGGASVIVGEDLTDDLGHFTIRGARPGGMHLVCVDPGGPRAVGRIVDRAIVASALTPLDDVVVMSGHELNGRVVRAGADGDGIAGALVRVAPMGPRPGLGVLSFASERPGWLAGVEFDEVRLARLRRARSEQLQSLPVRAVTSGPDGLFALDAGTPGGVEILVEAPGYVSRVVSLPRPGALDTIALEPAPRLRVRVVDGSGQAVEGAQVMAGLRGFRGMGVLHDPVETDATGRAEVDCPGQEPPDGEDPTALLVARRAPGTPWCGIAVAPGPGEVVLRLPPRSPAVIRVLDHRGEPVSGATLSLAPTSDSLRLDGGVEAMRPSDSLVRGTTGPDGTLEVGALSRGEWEVRIVEATGGSPVIRRFDHGPRTPRHDVTLGTQEGGTIQVLDPGGRPVTDAHVALIRGGLPLATVVGGLPLHGWTDAAGQVRFESLPRTERGAVPGELHVQAEHPAFGVVIARWLRVPLADPDEPSDRDSFTLRFRRRATVSGRVTWLGRAPGETYRILVQGDGPVPRSTVTDAHGRYSIDGVSPGGHVVVARPRQRLSFPFSVQGWWGRAERDGRRKVTLESGGRHAIDFDFGSEGALRAPVVEGRITVNGAPPAHGTVVARVPWPGEAPLLADGHFRLELPTGAREVAVTARVEIPCPFTGATMALEQDAGTVDLPLGAGVGLAPERLEHDIEAVLVEVTLRRRSGTSRGEAIQGAIVGGFVPLSDRRGLRTDRDGVVRFAAERPESGELVVQLNASRYGPFRHSIPVAPGEDVIRVELAVDPLTEDGAGGR